VSGTALGTFVEPEVNMTTAMSSGLMLAEKNSSSLDRFSGEQMTVVSPCTASRKKSLPEKARATASALASSAKKDEATRWSTLTFSHMTVKFSTGCR